MFDLACAAILSGNRFLWSTLNHIGCQAQTIGSYGYGALADPMSTTSIALSGLLTLFVAVLGLRMILGQAGSGPDFANDAIKLVIVLLLATSWPAWRVIGHDMVLTAPLEVAHAIGGASGLPDDEAQLRSRLQYVDSGLVTMTMWGTGRMTDTVPDGNISFNVFRGIALSDDTGFGWGRILFLSSIIGPFAILQMSGGILLAVTPLIAGLLLFRGTSSIFFGWARGLGFCALGSCVLFLIQGVQLAILVPWIGDVVAQRASGHFTPSAPTELISLSIAFCVMTGGALMVIALVLFYPAAIIGRLAVHKPSDTAATGFSPDMDRAGSDSRPPQPSRAHDVREAVAATMRREAQERGAASPALQVSARVDGAIRSPEHEASGSADMLGSRYRRTRMRTSAAGTRRDRRS